MRFKRFSDAFMFFHHQGRYNIIRILNRMYGIDMMMPVVSIIKPDQSSYEGVIKVGLNGR